MHLQNTCWSEIVEEISGKKASTNCGIYELARMLQNVPTTTSTTRPMNEILMVPLDEFNRLSSYYQGQMTESALLNKAGRLAADQHLILRDKSMAVNIIKPMTTERGRLIKRVRTGTAQPDRYEGVEEPEGMVDAPVERLLKQFVKGQKPGVY